MLTPWAGYTGAVLVAAGETLAGVEAVGADMVGAYRGAGVTGIGSGWLGVTLPCDAVLGVRMAGAYEAEAGAGTPLPGLMPAPCRISGRTEGAASTGALATAPADTATRLDATGLRPAIAGAGTAVRPPGAEELAYRSGVVLRRTVGFTAYGLL